MKRRIVHITVLFTFGITLFFLLVLLFNPMAFNDGKQKEILGERKVAYNEIEKLTERLKEESGDRETLQELEDVLTNIDDTYGKPTKTIEVTKLLVISYIGCLFFILAVFSTCYFRMVKPFQKLEVFAKEVANGNLDFPLQIERDNLFGDFTWAFDFMRNELKTSRENEERAKRENKTLIAAISHDIKTPVSSIRAYAEALQNGMANTKERRERYLSVLIRKSDEVAKLTNDLFLHALSDMEKLQMDYKEYDANALIQEICEPFCAEYGEKLRIKSEIPKATIITDEKRLSQVFENIFSNAVKYAPESHIELSFQVEGKMLICGVRDYGEGMPPKDVPFVFQRFYRGENAKDVAGSGLGLFIAKYVMEKNGGFIQVRNENPGLTVTFGLPIKFLPLKD